MMDDMLDKTASSLVVVEKKPQRPGGCVGIFFQLFDWNSRFAKKKLFSKKLLPPVRMKQASKKFCGDEKQPKLRLIADENSGGFPSAKNSNGATSIDTEQKHEMRSPGLVARLMGLESMPTLQREKSKKVRSSSGFVSGKAERSVDDFCSYPREETNRAPAGGIVKHELRPQKLQKTSVCERQPIARFGAEKLPFRNVLSKSRKHHQKLPSPVKSPRNLSRKSSSKLIGAASRILDPGLQTGRPKYAPTYSTPRDTVMDERTHSLYKKLDDISDDIANFASSSCRNCGHFCDDVNSIPRVGEQPLIFPAPLDHCVGSSCPGPERSKTANNTTFYQESEEKRRECSEFGNFQSHVKLASYRSSLRGQIQRYSSSQQYKPPPKGLPANLIPNHKMPNQNQILRERACKLSATTVLNGTKNFVSVNQRSVSVATKSWETSRMYNGKFESEKRIGNSLNDSVPAGRKRRPNNLSRQGDSSSTFTSSIINKQSLGFPHSISGKKWVCNRNEDLQARVVDGSEVDNNVASFTFNSSVKQKAGTHAVAERMVQNDLRCDNSLQKLSVGDSNNDRRGKIEKRMPLSGDALGALLEQKLKELNCQGDDIDGNVPKKTTATILQELISALTSDMPFQQDNSAAISRERNSRSNCSLASNSKFSTSLQPNATAEKLSVDQPLDTDHLSPGSVLEAHFSAESCASSSVDGCQGHRMLTEPSDCSYDGQWLPNSDLELLDYAAASINTTKNSKEVIIEILNNVYEMLSCNILASCGLKGNRLEQAKDALLNAELVFHNATAPSNTVGSPINDLLNDELETLETILLTNFGCSLGGKEANLLRTFVLDSIFEYLNLRFEWYPKIGLRVLQKLPLHMNTNMLVFEIVEVVTRWEELTGFGLDELVEMEMSSSLGEWTECEVEAIETGMEISRHVFQILVDEIVSDILKF